MVLGGLLAGATSKAAKATGLDNETSARIVKEAVETNPDDPIPEIYSRFEKVLKENDAPDLEIDELRKMIKIRLRDELEKTERWSYRGRIQLETSWIYKWYSSLFWFLNSR